MLRNIPSTTLRRLVVLSERKEALMTRVQDIEHEMVQIQRRFESLARSTPPQITVTRPKTTKPRRQVGRGELKTRIVSALRAAGTRGLTISELSKKLRVKRANLYVWFNGTGRNVRGLKKVGPANYRLTA
jgi:hypothetical protein